MTNTDSEILEQIALSDLHAAASNSDVASLGLAGINVGSAFVSVAANLPPSAIVVNRTLGMGLPDVATRTEVESIVSIYAQRNVARFFIQIHPGAGPANLSDLLQSVGLRRARGWQKFVRGRTRVEQHPTSLNVREIGADQGENFARIICNAFDLGPQAIPWLSRLPGRPGWHVFMSFEDERPAGVGALFVHGELGWTDFGATAPEFRRRGSQGAIMSARLSRALELGCRQVHTCTGVAVPGDPQHSYNNIRNAGFVEDYVRENYEPA